jgi:hypothetical protein
MAEEGKPTSDAAEVSKAEESRARLSDRAELERVIELYMMGDYLKCSSELSAFLNPKGPAPFEEAEVIEQGRLYFASCALLEGRKEQARKALRDALENNPLMHSPDSLTFPPPVVSLFLEVRDEVQQLITDSEREQVVRLRREYELARRRAEQREYRERELEKLAREELVVVRNSRLLATVPFGVGQFQNGNKGLGAAFLVSEGLLLATAVTSGLILEDLTSRASRGNGQLTDTELYNSRAGTAYDVLTWSSWGLIGVAALGILEAHLSYKPERQLEKRNRPLPPELEISPEEEPKENSNGLKIEPTWGVLPGGGVLGVAGSF